MHDTVLLHVEPSSPASGTLITGPEPALLVCPLLLPAPAELLAPPALRTALPGVELLEQLAIAVAAAR